MSTSTTQIDQTLLTPADVADQLGLRVRTVRTWARRGLIDSVRVGAGGRRIGLHPSVIDQIRREA